MNRILFDCERTKYPNTGLFQFCLELGTALISLHDTQNEELIFYVPEKQNQLFGNGQHYVIQNHLHKFFQFQTGRFNVWHNTYQSSKYHPFNKTVKEVITLHDLNFLVEHKNDLKKLKRYLKRVQKNVDRADHVVCISEFTKNTVLEHLKLGDKPLDTIYNGCNINIFEGDVQPEYKPPRPFIFSIGRVVPLKNLHVLPCLLDGNDYDLIIAGEANVEYEMKIRQQAKLLGVEDRVKIPGIISERDKSWYYKNCAAFVFPSLAEGFGFPLVEAMFYGKPVFISTSSSLPEIGGSLAYHFDNFDCCHMREVFARGMQHFEDLRPGELLHKRALRFNWQQTAKDYLAIYRQLY